MEFLTPGTAVDHEEWLARINEHVAETTDRRFIL
jgi:hypothetical protein